MKLICSNCGAFEPLGVIKFSELTRRFYCRACYEIRFTACALCSNQVDTNDYETNNDLIVCNTCAGIKLIAYKVTYGHLDYQFSAAGLPVLLGNAYFDCEDRVTCINRFDAVYPGMVIFAIVNLTDKRVEFDRYAIGE